MQKLDPLSEGFGVMYSILEHAKQLKISCISTELMIGYLEAAIKNEE